MLPSTKMPTTLFLLCCAWLIAISGVAIGTYTIFINKLHNPQAFIISVTILLGSLFLSALVRMISNIGQMLFDIKSLLYNNQQAFAVKDVLSSQLALINDTKAILKMQSENVLNELKILPDLIKSQSALVNDTKAILKMQSENVLNELKALSELIKQANCDAKDINQNIYQIRNFFEQIERHLDLKK